MTPPTEPLYPVNDGMKICCRENCVFNGKPQPVGNFEKSSKLKDGISGHCKSCKNTYKRAWLKRWRTENPHKAAGYSARARKRESYKVWYAANRERLNKNTREWRKDNPEATKLLYVTRRFRQYGITKEWYDQQLEAQGFVCDICKSADPKSSSGTFHIDHDHRCCGKSCKACDKCRRGLLCSVCNTWLGILEKEEWVAKAQAYLARYGSNLTS